MRARVTLTITAAVVLVVMSAQPASAALTAKVSVSTASGKSRLVVVLTSSSRLSSKQKPKRVSLVARGRTYKLTRAPGARAAAVSLGTWRSSPVSGAAATTLQALAGTKVSVQVTPANGRTAKLSVKIAKPGGTTTPILPGDDPIVTPVTPGNGPLFGTPGTDKVGQAAYDAIKGFLADSTFTDCPATWPNCAVEYRYGHFANGNVYYCRLTNTSGSDIINGASPITQILGAEQHADGSWAVSYARDSYGNTVYYTWRVSAAGDVTGLYWGPGTTDPSTAAPTEQISGLVWVRGARDCSY